MHTIHLPGEWFFYFFSKRSEKFSFFPLTIVTMISCRFCIVYHDEKNEKLKSWILNEPLLNFYFSLRLMQKRVYHRTIKDATSFSNRVSVHGECSNPNISYKMLIICFRDVSFLSTTSKNWHRIFRRSRWMQYCNSRIFQSNNRDISTSITNHKVREKLWEK